MASHPDVRSAYTMTGVNTGFLYTLRRSFQVMTFEDRALSSEEHAQWWPALKLGAEARQALRGRPLAHYVDDLTAVRRVTLERLAVRDDGWLDRSVATAPKINIHWAWFHAAEDEINHRGQIRWLRKRLPNRGSTGSDT